MNQDHKVKMKAILIKNNLISKNTKIRLIKKIRKKLQNKQNNNSPNKK